MDNNHMILAGYLTDSLGSDFEIMYCEVSDASFVPLSLHNGHISGRSLTSVFSPSMKATILRELELQKTYFDVYFSNKNSNQLVKFSILPFYGEEQEPIGFISIGKSIETINDDEVILKPEKTPLGQILPLQSQNHVRETASIIQQPLSVNKLTQLAETLDEKLDEFTSKDSNQNGLNKTDFIEQLDAMGVFQIKGAVAKVAKLLKISESTVYRTLKAIANRETSENDLLNEYLGIEDEKSTIMGL